MDLGPWVHAILEDANAPLAAAFLIGLLASLGPCPLATNVTALGYISKEISSLRRVLFTCGLYALGRTLAYGGLGIAVLAAGFHISRVSNSLQTLAEIALGPLLILVGLVLLDVIRPAMSIGGVWMERFSARVANWHYLGAFSLGVLFALAFCPYSAALYFGVLIPLAFKWAGGMSFPLLFGLGTSVPVIVVGVPLALGVGRFAAGFNMLRVARVERVMRKAAALVFIGAGLFILLSFSSACTAASTPTPVHLASPTPVPVPAVTGMPPRTLLPAPGVGGRNAPPDVPACPGATSLAQPIQFSWAGMDDIVRDTPETNWTYYRCGGAESATAAFYRQWMPQPPYNWLEVHWEERAELTMGVYFHKDPDRWLYLWFLPEESTVETSDLVAAWWNVRPSC